MNKWMINVITVPALMAMTSVSGFAYEMVKKQGDRHEHKDIIEIDMNRNGVSDKVTLIKKTQRDCVNYDVVKNPVLQIEERGQVVTAHLGEDICYNSSGLESVTISDKVDPFIAVSSNVPCSEDDWLVILYSFDGKAIVEQLKVVSNEPSIEIKDADDDGVKEIVVTDRDYENKPQEDKFLTTYKYVDNKWKKVSVYRTKTKELTKL